MAGPFLYGVVLTLDEKRGGHRRKIIVPRICRHTECKRKKRRGIEHSFPIPPEASFKPVQRYYTLTAQVW